MKRTLLTTLATLTYFLLKAQLSAPYNKEASEELYWKYRERLKEFVVVGDGKGESLPALKIKYNDRDSRQKGFIGFGDIGIELGWYISMLATEYALLEGTNRPNEKTIEELYYALKAYERIDKAGDTHRCVGYPQGAAEMNGFFIRDDVDQTLFENNPEFAARFVDPTNTERGGFNFGSDYVAGSCSDDMGFFNSPDQVASLFMGFALVKKSVPASVTYNGYSIKQMAVNSAKAIADHYKGNNWRGTGPNGEKISKYHKSFLEEGELLGLGGAADWITSSNDYETSVKNLIRSFSSPSPFTSIWGPILGLELYKDVWRKRFEQGSYPHSVMSDSYWIRQDDFVISHNSIFAAIASNIGPSVNGHTVRRRISEIGEEFNVEIFALLNSYLHGTGLVNSGDILGNIKSYLAEAPCSGPHFYYRNGGVDSGILGWRAHNRWIRSMKGAVGGWGYNEEGGYYVIEGINDDFNGLDYMVAHNLLLLYNRQKYEDIEDKISGEFELCGRQVKSYRYLPQADKIEWSTSGDLEIIGNATDREVSVRRTGTFNYGGSWIRARVENCGLLITEKAIMGSKPVVVIDPLKERYSYRLELEAGSGSLPITQQQINHVSWELLDSNPNYVDLDPSPVGLYANISGRGTPWSATIKVTISNDCGITTLYEYLEHEGDIGTDTGDGEGIGGPIFGRLSNVSHGLYIKKEKRQDIYSVRTINEQESGITKSADKAIPIGSLNSAAVFTLNGLKVKEFYDNEYYVGDLPSGIYILKVEVVGTDLNKKIIVK